MKRGEKKTPLMTRVAVLRRLAGEGKTRSQAAAELGINPVYVGQIARRFNVPFRHGNERDGAMNRRQKSPIQRVKVSGVLDDVDPNVRLDALVLIHRGGASAAEALTILKRPDLAARAIAMGV